MVSSVGDSHHIGWHIYLFTSLEWMEVQNFVAAMEGLDIEKDYESTHLDEIVWKTLVHCV